MGEGMFHLDVLPAPSLRNTILGVINGSLTGGRLSHDGVDPQFDHLTSGDIDVLSRFQTRTIPTLETPHTRGLYQTEILILAGQVCNISSQASTQGCQPPSVMMLT